VAVAWCQFGSPQELPNIKHRKEYEAELDSQPDYRLTCFFVDKRYRRRGVSALALQGALDLIAAAGGGVVEAYPQDTGGIEITASFLYSVTRIVCLCRALGNGGRHIPGSTFCLRRSSFALPWAT
jgi:polysaccharide pyruvyl transferase WcaK-like protein